MNSWGEAFGEKGTLRLLRQDSEEWVRWSEVFALFRVDGVSQKEPTVGCNQNLSMSMYSHLVILQKYSRDDSVISWWTWEVMASVIRHFGRKHQWSTIQHWIGGILRHWPSATSGNWLWWWPCQCAGLWHAGAPGHRGHCEGYDID